VVEIVFNRLVGECDLGYLDQDIGSTRFDFRVFICCCPPFFLLGPKFHFLLYCGYFVVIFVQEIVFNRHAEECDLGYLDRDIGSTSFDFRVIFFLSFFLLSSRAKVLFSSLFFVVIFRGRNCFL